MSVADFFWGPLLPVLAGHHTHQWVCEPFRVGAGFHTRKRLPLVCPEPPSASVASPPLSTESQLKTPHLQKGFSMPLLSVVSMPLSAGSWFSLVSLTLVPFSRPSERVHLPNSVLSCTSQWPAEGARSPHTRLLSWNLCLIATPPHSTCSLAGLVTAERIPPPHPQLRRWVAGCSVTTLYTSLANVVLWKMCRLRVWFFSTQTCPFPLQRQSDTSQ